MKHLLCAMAAICIFATSFAQNISIIPEPESVTPMQTIFSLSAENTKILSSNAKKAEKTISFFNNYLKKYYGIELSKESSRKNSIIFNLTPKQPNDTLGAYSLTVTDNSITIDASSEEGLFYGMQSLIQLLPTTASTTLNIPGVVIKDAPRLAYRGMMLDCGRHFMPADFVKQFIDYLALHKLNTFHWHLTEDQGWRIEIKKYPRLTEVGAWRNGTITGRYPGNGNDNQKTGGFYTQKQIREIVKYAADRYITIIPEIEMPGHSSAAIAAYPQLSCFPDQSTVINKNTTWAGSKDGKQVEQTWGVFPDVYAPTEYTFKFIENVLDEVIKLFPSKYIHIGGDECPKDYWNKSTYCQELMKNKGLKNAEELQSYFIQRIEKYLNSKGREIIGWDEILEGGLAPKATVMSWRGEEGGIAAAKQNHDVIMSPSGWMYFDHSQTKPEDSLTIGGFLPIQKVYNYNPYPNALTAAEHQHILGVQANVWTEYMSSPQKVEYMIFPRMAALAEVGWTEPANKNYESFKDRLQPEIARYRLWGANYCKDWDNQPTDK
ncbi:beta-N-acetylhexosaminidase [Arachidicoccus soli]|uniref:beta-N-acetylhexosaminidase n=1 Tax=Arachidicoccus soli TaxID=2341117 RepID=A0A386HKM8_9BACT|nr:beta-N-acetylhexosaminidase [Arachidicoccus soli]AYD46285.1 beta-N-acetylhexosaminidase [Arachidicoccus soli]